MGRTRKGEKPIEDNTSIGTQVDVCDRSKCTDEKRGEGGSAGLVDVGEDLGSVALFTESVKGAGAGVDGGASNRSDGDANASVDDVGKRFHASPANDDDEGGEPGVPGSSTSKSLVVPWDEN